MQNRSSTKVKRSGKETTKFYGDWSYKLQFICLKVIRVSIFFPIWGFLSIDDISLSEAFELGCEIAMKSSEEGEAVMVAYYSLIF